MLWLDSYFVFYTVEALWEMNFRETEKQTNTIILVRKL